jgi:O-antigen/teichoic acid export membrane protein
MLAATPLLIGRGWRVRPRFARPAWRRLLGESLPLAISYALSLVYFRVLLLILSVSSTEHATGIFGTSLRIFELLLGIPTLTLGVALPLLAASVENRERLRYQVQRLAEVAMLVATGVAVTAALAAGPIIEILGGPQYRDAVGVFQIHVFAFIPVFVANVCQMALIALGRQRVLVGINAAALVLLFVLGITIVPSHGPKAAAVISIVAETALAGMTYWAIHRQPIRPVLTIRFAWRVAFAGAAAMAVGVLAPLPALPAAIIGALTFAVLVLALRALPRELLVELRRGASA